MNEQIEDKNRPAKRRQIAASFVALGLVAVIATAGTYAWNATQSALNEARGSVQTGGRLHNDFNGQNADIYVENYGITPLYVRVKLTEYMEIGVGAGLKGAYNSATGTYAADPGDQAVSFDHTAQIGDPSTWTVHVPAADNPAQGNGGTLDKFSKYWTWTMGGSKNYMPTFNKDNTNFESDITGLTTMGMTNLDYEHQVSDPANGGTNIYGAATAPGSHDQFTAGATETQDATYTDPSLNGQETHTAKPTLGATVMTMAQWASGGSHPGPYWVMDTDGWAYWAQPLTGNTATGLLLSEIDLANQPTGDWYYAINPKAQTVTADDLAMFSDGTANAQHLLNLVSGNIPVTAAYFPDPAFLSYVETNFDLDHNGVLSPAERDTVTSIQDVGTTTEPIAITSIAGIEYFPNLTDLSVQFAPGLTSVDLSRNTALKTLNLRADGLTALDVSNNTALTHLTCNVNYIQSLDLSHNPELTYLYAPCNHLASIDLSKNTQLTDLDVRYSQLATLDLSNNKALVSLLCSANLLTSLNLSGIPGLSNGSGLADGANLTYASQGGTYTSSLNKVLYDTGAPAYTLTTSDITW